VDPSIAFAQMGGNLQACETYPSLSSLDEATGFTCPGNGAVLGSAMRFGKVSDPKGSGRKVFRHAMKSSDPYTAGNVHRVDVMPPGQNLSKGVDYWVAWEMYLPSNTYFANDYSTLMNIHTGAGGISGNFGVGMDKGVLEINRNTNYAAFALTPTPLPDQWVKMMVQFRLSTGSDGYIRAWVNGTQTVNANGANTPSDGGDYVKMAFYNYSWGGGYGDNSRPEREMFYGRFYIIKDAGYTAQQVGALLQ
jgi:hypothetical protein